jgi:hypothetical protein
VPHLVPSWDSGRWSSSSFVFLGSDGARGGAVYRICFLYVRICFFFVASSSSSSLFASHLLRRPLRGEIHPQWTYSLIWMMLGLRCTCTRLCLCGLSELLVPVALLCDVGFRVCLELLLLFLFHSGLMMFVYLLLWSMMMSIALGGMFYHAAVPTFVVE